MKMKGNASVFSLVKPVVVTAFFTGFVVSNVSAVTAETKNFRFNIIDPFKSYSALADTKETFKSFEEEGKLLLRLAKNEYESGSFLLRAQERDYNNIKLSLSKPKKDDGTNFPGEIDLKIVKKWFQGGCLPGKQGHVYQDSKEARYIPELLLNDDELIRVDKKNKKNYLRLSKPAGNEYVLIGKGGVTKSNSHYISEFPVHDAKKVQPFKLARNERKQIWVTIHAPVSTPPGLYKGTVELVHNAKKISIIPLQIEVLPFNLPEPSKTWSIYYRSKLDPAKASVSSEYKNEQQMRAELLDLKAHGVVNPTVYQKFNEAKNLEKTLALRQELGMNGGALYYLGLTTAAIGDHAIEKTRREISNLQRLVRKYGFSELYVYGVDEAVGAALIAQKKTRKAVRNANAKIIVAGKKGHFDEIGNLTNILVLHSSLSSNEVAKAHAIGSKILSYQEPQTGPENPQLFRYRYGIALWQSGFDGPMPYAYQHGFGSIWNDFDNYRYRDHVFAYPTSDGVVRTIAWEGYREAIDDLRYIEKLESLINGGVKKNNSYRAARKYLKGLKATQAPDPDAVRENLIKHILSVLVYPEKSMPQVESLRITK